MPKTDIYHEAVRHALIKDGWRITHDFFPLAINASMWTWGQFDDEQVSYALVKFGWLDRRGVLDSLSHIDISGDKIGVQQDRTEDGAAIDLVEAGISKGKIVLGF